MKTATRAERSFWDASGVVLLCLDQPGTAAARRLLSQGGQMVLWWGTAVEARSAVQRSVRSQLVDPARSATALRRLTVFHERALQVEPSEEVRTTAMTLIERYDLRAGDALQMAAALVWSNFEPRGRRFVCFDKKLAEAADMAGFSILPSR